MENTSLQVFNTTIKTEGEYIFVKPVCDFFNIDYDNQAEKIRLDPVLTNSCTKKTHIALFGDSYPRLCLSKKGFLRWIQLINPSILPEEMQERFVKYQADIFDFMYGTAEQESRLRALVEEDNRTEEELIILRRARRLVRASLRQALNARFQYSINFSNSQALNK